MQALPAQRVDLHKELLLHFPMEKQARILSHAGFPMEDQQLEGSLQSLRKAVQDASKNVWLPPSVASNLGRGSLPHPTIHSANALSSSAINSTAFMRPSSEFSPIEMPVPAKDAVRWIPNGMGSAIITGPNNSQYNNYRNNSSRSSEMLSRTSFENGVQARALSRIPISPPSMQFHPKMDDTQLQRQFLQRQHEKYQQQPLLPTSAADLKRRHSVVVNVRTSYELLDTYG